MDKSEAIKNFINAIVNENEDECGLAFSEICKNSSQKFLAPQKSPLVEATQRLETFKANLMEELNQNGAEPISFDGQKILVNGKVVGTVTTDMEDFNSGIDFHSIDGKFSKEFITVEELTQYIAQQYLGDAA